MTARAVRQARIANHYRRSPAYLHLQESILYGAHDVFSRLTFDYESHSAAWHCWAQATYRRTLP